MKINKVLIIAILVFCLFIISCNAQLPSIKWLVKLPAYNAFWLSDGKLIGTLEGGGNLSVLDVKGTILWKKDINNQYITRKLNSLSYDGVLRSFNINNAEETGEKKLNGNYIGMIGGVDGTLVAISQNGFKVLTESGELLWEKDLINFRPIIVLPRGKAVIGMYYPPKPTIMNEVLIQIIDSSGLTKTIKRLSDAALYESPSQITAYSKELKITVLGIETSSWWTTISDSGTILLNKAEMPIKRANLITPCGNGFAFASNLSNQLIVLSEHGKTIWSKEFESQIRAISGNSSYVAVSVGLMGKPGKIYFFTKKGDLVNSIDVPLSTETIRISESTSLLVCITVYSNVYLIDFKK